MVIYSLFSGLDGSGGGGGIFLQNQSLDGHSLDSHLESYIPVDATCTLGGQGFNHLTENSKTFPFISATIEVIESSF